VGQTIFDIETCGNRLLITDAAMILSPHLESPIKLKNENSFYAYVVSGSPLIAGLTILALIFGGLSGMVIYQASKG
jgi:hypothetical protein